MICLDTSVDLVCHHMMMLNASSAIDNLSAQLYFSTWGVAVPHPFTYKMVKISINYKHGDIVLEHLDQPFQTSSSKYMKGLAPERVIHQV